MILSWLIKLYCKTLDYIRDLASIALDEIDFASVHLGHEVDVWYVSKNCNVFTKKTNLICVVKSTYAASWVSRWLFGWNFVTFLRILLLFTNHIFSIFSLRLCHSCTHMRRCLILRLSIKILTLLNGRYASWWPDFPMFLITRCLTQLSFYKFGKLLILALNPHKSTFFTFQQRALRAKYLINSWDFLFGNFILQSSCIWRISHWWINRSQTLYHAFFIIYQFIFQFV